MKLNQIPIPFFKDGVIRESAIDEVLALPTSVDLAVNGHFDRIGAITTRLGTTLIGSQVEADKPILGMANYINNAGDKYRLLAKADTNVYAYDGSSWTSVRSSISSTGKARFTNFIDLTYMVNGNANQNLSTYNGTTFGTSNIGDFTTGDYIENFRSRIWVADSSTDKVYYSDVVSTTQTITGGTSFIQISPQDGDMITGLKRHPRALLVFKKNHIYRIFSINATDPDPSINVGTYSQESIVEAKDGMYFHHSSGFYKFNFNGAQIELSKPIQDIVDAIPRANYDNVVGWEDGDHVYWSIGDITLGGISMTNVVVRRTISTQLWTTYSYGSEIRSASWYDDGTNLINTIGDDVGNVLQVNKGDNDNGTTIFYNVESHWYYITNNKSDLKSITEVVCLFENAQGANISYKLDNDSTNKWRPLKQVSKHLTQKMPLNAKNFTRIKFRISGTIDGSPLIFRGFELLSGDSYTK